MGEVRVRDPGAGKTQNQQFYCLPKIRGGGWGGAKVYGRSSEAGPKNKAKWGPGRGACGQTRRWSRRRARRGQQKKKRACARHRVEARRPRHRMEAPCYLQSALLRLEGQQVGATTTARPRTSSGNPGRGGARERSRRCGAPTTRGRYPMKFLLRRSRRWSNDR